MFNNERLSTIGRSIRKMTLQLEKGKQKVYLSTSVDPGVKKAIDEVRGILSRSQYTQLALSERIAKDRSSSKKNEEK